MTSLAFNVNQSVGLSTPQPTEIQELTLDEIEAVNGGLPWAAGIVIGAIIADAALSIIDGFSDAIAGRESAV